MTDQKRESRTSWGAPIPSVYGPEEVPAERLAQDLGKPGEFPFTRGVHPEMHRKRLWTMRQYAGFGSAAETNKRYRFLLEQGQTGLSVAFDLPTQMGYDPDASMARGEAGKVGVSIASLEDMQDLFAGIPLDRVSTSMTINATAAILLALYVATASRQGVAAERLSGTVQNDILKEYIARGTYIFPPGPSMRLVIDTFAYCRDRVPRWNTISISGYHVREAGCTAVQEVAFTLANGIAYVQAALDAGLAVDDFAPQLSFFFNAHNDLVEEVAKFRAARRLWARIMRERFHAMDPRALALRFHAQTAGSMLTAQQPENNIVRVAIQALAAVLGGCQSLHTNSMDEALSSVPCGSPSGPSRSSPTNRGWPRWPILSGVPSPSSASRTTSRRRRASTSRRSTTWAARSRPSRSCSARSRRPPTATSVRSRITPGSWSASTSSSRTSRRPVTSSRSTRRSARPSPAGWRARAPRAIARRSGARSTRSRAGPAAVLTSCRCW
jgi:methylmalonyl-CoA mutase N-terminal domain/subunit